LAQSDSSASGYAAKTYYRGEIARNYEHVRRTTAAADRKWRSEQEALAGLLSQLPAGSTILDAPCGTGRFAPLFRELELRSIGVDISSDMLAMHRSAAMAPPGGAELFQADLEQLPLGDASVDYVVSMRFFNLVPLEIAHRVLREFNRVARAGAIIEVRLAGEKPGDGVLRTLRRRAAMAKPGAGGDPSSAASPSGPEPLRVHRSSDFLTAARSAGWCLESMTDVLPNNRLQLQPDSLQLAELRPAD
jgi:ubiquinone/menaquinone biosynthesis C-methylase UbiE